MHLTSQIKNLYLCTQDSFNALRDSYREALLFNIKVYTIDHLKIFEVSKLFELLLLLDYTRENFMICMEKQ